MGTFGSGHQSHEYEIPKSMHIHFKKYPMTYGNMWEAHAIYRKLYTLLIRQCRFIRNNKCDIGWHHVVLRVRILSWPLELWCWNFNWKWIHVWFLWVCQRSWPRKMAGLILIGLFRSQFAPLGDVDSREDSQRSTFITKSSLLSREPTLRTWHKRALSNSHQKTQTSQ